ncbi:MAG TPA: TIGR04283 family arsenosugar biosynthesis glycosyltransferase, partial [Wenzhouxiangella sp.]|nr:TIGR04283 family arsenosugar biosynthesis glycosyltransferase [Wenzhouxiangella sp.]
IPTLGADGAADLQRRMTEYTLKQALAVGIPVEVRFTGGSIGQMRQWLGTQPMYVDQGEGDLGTRMNRAFQEHFDRGARRVVIIGCDCPENRSDTLARAFELLENESCVIGPAHDGGYYLIGLNRPQPELFHGIDWGTAQVLEQTLAATSRQIKLLPPLSDVDEAEDLPLKISVIIPVLNEKTHIEKVVSEALEGFDVECVVADGGSDDGTCDLAQRAGALVCHSGPGRARQMNAGAEQASGDILLFLHADSRLPKEWDTQVRRTLRRPEVALGAFRFGVDENSAGYFLITWGTNLRSRWFKRPYGDQGLFLKRDLFEKMGRFAEVPIMEDVDLVRKARQKGKIVTLNQPLITSARRWKKHGLFKTTLHNQYVLLAASAGVDPVELNQAYRQGINPLPLIFKRLKAWGVRSEE